MSPTATRPAARPGHEPLPGQGRPRRPFTRSFLLPGREPGSWGFDGVLECYWAELPAPAGGGAVRVGPEHLLTTVPALARALAREAGAGDLDVYLALTASAPAGGGRPAVVVSEDQREEIDMGVDDKAANTGESLGGKLKEAVGGATGDRDLQAEGQADQSGAALKQAGEKVKDAFK